MTDHKTEALAMAYASIDGRLGEFMTCKADADAEDRLGRYGGYMAEADQMRRFLRKHGYYLSYCPGMEASRLNEGRVARAEALDELQRLGQEYDNHD